MELRNAYTAYKVQGITGPTKNDDKSSNNDDDFKYDSDPGATTEDIDFLDAINCITAKENMKKQNICN